MALPGLSLPGLGLQSSTTPVYGAVAPPPAEEVARKENLPAQSEWRFEVAFGRPYSIKLLTGHAELFGVELAPSQTYNLSGYKGAIFTWQGCQLEITGEAESEYSAQETEYAVEWLNLHGMLETARDEAPADGGPRVMVVGPDNAGKSSLVRSVAAWAVKAGRTPTVVNLDPREGLLSPPASFTAVTVGSQLDVEAGFGIAPISGPIVTPTKNPLIYSFPYAASSEKPDVYKAVITRMALSVTNKMEEDSAAKRSGFIIDTPGSLNDPKSNYDLLHHVVSEFSINVIITTGSDKLLNDLNRRFGPGKGGDENIHVLRVTKPGGAVERDQAYMRQLRTAQVRQYFFGSSKEPLNPHSHSLNYGELNIYRARSAAEQTAATGFGADNDDDDYDPAMSSTPTPSNALFEKVTPSVAMTGSMLAIKFCSGNSSEDSIRDSAVMGFLYVADVDESKKKVRFLAPHPQRWGDRALLWGAWPEAVPDLVT
ncbi:SAICAR synthase-like protein [Hortaea werneckii]|nr:SAICAR synthase-like protein [Hortaea werneckii]